VPGYQSRGLGYQIKLMQRDFARSEGVDRIAWAFDPLQAGNAHFNLSRLGASATRFIANMYGERTDALNDRVPTDRLIVEWEIATDHTVSIDLNTIPTLPRLITIREQAGGHNTPVALSVETLRESPRILLEIPWDITALRRDDPQLAEKWRAVVNEAFPHAFEAGFRAIHFVRDESAGRRRGFYVLDRL
jgi:predicted GNAT superfamily acetyltransferase